MQYRRLGRTGLNVSEIGYGAWGIGKAMWVGAEDEESIRSLKAARDAGVNFFDTALAYGAGHSEKLIARAFGKPPDVLIASKVPPKNQVWPVPPGTPLREAFPKDYVLACLDQTLTNLGRDYVDLYQFHVWTDEWATQDEWLDTARQIRASGKARAIGISINDHQPANSLKVLDTGLVEVVQVIYNIFDQSPEDELFPYCRKHDIGVIARVPFDEGGLTGKIGPETTFPDGDFRERYFAGRKQEVWDRVQRIAKDTSMPMANLPELALRFCLSDPAVSTVIPGMRNPAHVAANTAASDAGPLPSEVLQKLRTHRWVHNF
ncbi:MAG TPA: aldo/keto reductase [Clostridia bacterium]|nr:aldo/keto reductase [Clostridia bacterium]